MDKSHTSYVLVLPDGTVGIRMDDGEPSYIMTREALTNFALDILNILKENPHAAEG